MSANKPLEFQQAVIRKRLVSPDQLKDALKAQTGLKDLGIEKDISEVMVEKGFMSKIVAIQVRSSIGWERVPSISGYRIKKKLGKGGMGAVYLAIRTHDDLACALKLLNAEYSQNDAYIRRFLKEADFCITLDHPNLVKGYETGISGDYYFFAMELIDGISYDRPLKRKKVITWEEALDILIGVGRALLHAQKIKLVHRDIKPANIMISKNRVVKLCDLGLSKSVGSDLDLTKTGTVVGTPYYIAPELAAGSKDLSIKSDMYSLGASVYHLLAGRPPHSAKDVTTLFLKHQGAKIPVLSKFAPDIDRRVEAVIHKLLNKKPEKRMGPEKLVDICVKIQESVFANSDSFVEIDPIELDSEEMALFEDEPEVSEKKKSKEEIKASSSEKDLKKESEIYKISDSQSVSKIQKKRSLLARILGVFFLLGIILVTLAVLNSSKNSGEPDSNNKKTSSTKLSPELILREKEVSGLIERKEWEAALITLKLLLKQLESEKEPVIVKLVEKLNIWFQEATYHWLSSKYFPDSFFEFGAKSSSWKYTFEKPDNTWSWSRRSNNSTDKVRIEDGSFLVQSGYLALKLRELEPIQLTFKVKIRENPALFRLKLRDWEIYFEDNMVRLMLNSKEVERISIPALESEKWYKIQVSENSERFSCLFDRKTLFKKEADKIHSEKSISWLVKQGKISIGEVNVVGQFLDSYIQKKLKQLE